MTIQQMMIGGGTFISDGGLPPSLNTSATFPPFDSNSAAIWFEYRADGVCAWGTLVGGSSVTNGSGAYSTSPSAYEIEFTQTATNGAGSLTGVGGGWLALTSTRRVQLQDFAGGVPGTSGSATRTIRVRIREAISGLVQVDISSVGMSVTVGNEDQSS